MILTMILIMILINNCLFGKYKGVVYHLSKAELDKWDAEHQIELSESSHQLSGRKLSIMSPIRSTQPMNAMTAKQNPETEI